jgi:pimeloyl-ACP methyl ester carboxylesterase
VSSRRIALATGLSYNVNEWDGPGDLTFVLVHGFADLGAAWRPVAEQLAEKAHVVAPDMRGHGDSDWLRGGGYYHFMDYVADLDDVIRQCARARVVLVGHSMGGMVSGYYAGVRPERLAALCLLEGLGPPDQGDAEGPTRTQMWIDSWGKSRREPKKTLASLEEAAARLRKNDHLLGEAQAMELAELGTRPIDGGFAWKHDPLHNTFGPYVYRVETAMKYWARVTCPVLAVDGADSRLNLSLEERARRRSAFANVRHEIVAGAGHAVPRHQPAAVAKLLIGLAEFDR